MVVAAINYWLPSAFSSSKDIDLTNFKNSL
jgi:hypothetical protein